VHSELSGGCLHHSRGFRSRSKHSVPVHVWRRFTPRRPQNEQQSWTGLVSVYFGVYRDCSDTCSRPVQDAGREYKDEPTLAGQAVKEKTSIDTY
jgi:hypothetical protein